jgi:adenylate cyclase
VSSEGCKIKASRGFFYSRGGFCVWGDDPVSEEQAKRKLAAILSADAKDYSRLMEDDEEATVKTITAYRELMVSQIQNQNGRVVDAKGDNILAEFSSVVDAVRCAVEIQREVGRRNGELPEHRRMEFRIGVNLGDVIEEDETIYGDGVNIAARLEALAEGGGICVSGTAFDHVEGKLGLEFKYLGEQAVKNIKKQVRVYRVKKERGVSDFEIRQELPLPDKPSIAVLPFANMSGDPEQEFFSDGLSEDIITSLSQLPDMLVIARNSTFTYKGKSVKVQHVGRELGVRYVLEGSVRKAGGRVRITAQLIDATTGHHLWAERYDRDLEDIFAIQDEITLRILKALQVKLIDGEQAPLFTKGTENIEAYLKTLQARSCYRRYDRGSNLLARQICEEVIALDPQYPMPYAILGRTYWSDVFLGWTDSPRESVQRAFASAQKCIALDDSSPAAHGLLSWVYLMKREHDRAILEAEKAVSLDPNSADAHMWLGNVLNFAGKPDEAISVLERAIRLNPLAPSSYLPLLGMAYREAGKYEESITACKKALQRQPSNIYAHIVLAATYSLLNRQEEAHAAAAEVLRIDPKFSLDYFAESRPHIDPANTARLIETLRKAGLK